jgi:hypothetical protein
MYLDPGFGSMVIQMAIAGIAAMGASFFLFRQKIKELLKFGRGKKSQQTAEDEQRENETQE